MSYFIASAKDPGYLRPQHDFLELLSRIHPCEMCPDCEVLRTPRSRHCAICNRCVERFDHHCPWLNNCVGIHNHNFFIVFLVSLSSMLLVGIISCVYTLVAPCNGSGGPPIDEALADECPLQEFCVGCNLVWLRIILIILAILLTLFFSLPVCYLNLLQLQNYTLNKTSNERFARTART